jgi:hypothetical protein
MKPVQTVMFLLLIPMIIPCVSAQDVTVVTVDYRELQLVPEDTSNLTRTVNAFNVEPALVDLLEDNQTIFWQPLGGFNENFTQAPSLSSYAIVQVNQSGFYQKIVALNSESGNLEWIRPLQNQFVENYSLVIRAATDFFANDGHYWGLCERIVVVPGVSVGVNSEAVWIFKFHLVAESERWTLYIDTDGVIQDSSSQEIPCQSCNNNTVLAVLGLSTSVVAVVLVGAYLRKRLRGFDN